MLSSFFLSKILSLYYHIFFIGIVFSLYLSEEVHGGDERDHGADQVDDGGRVKPLATHQLHDAVVEVVGGEVEYEDDKEVVGCSHCSSASASKEEAETEVEHTI